MNINDDSSSSVYGYTISLLCYVVNDYQIVIARHKVSCCLNFLHTHRRATTASSTVFLLTWVVKT